MSLFDSDLRHLTELHPASTLLWRPPLNSCIMSLGVSRENRVWEVRMQTKSQQAHISRRSTDNKVSAIKCFAGIKCSVLSAATPTLSLKVLPNGFYTASIVTTAVQLSLADTVWSYFHQRLL